VIYSIGTNIANKKIKKKDETRREGNNPLLVTADGSLNGPDYFSSRSPWPRIYDGRIATLQVLKLSPKTLKHELVGGFETNHRYSVEWAMEYA
jgi:hypothetical protein